MIFVDSNVPMYLVGMDHPNKSTAQLLLERYSALGQRLVSDAEVIQEIAHRYRSIRRYGAIRQAVRQLLRFVDEVYPIEQADAMRGCEIVVADRGLTARDALHLAIMERHGVKRAISFDADFDRWPGITRIWQL